MNKKSILLPITLIVPFITACPIDIGNDETGFTGITGTTIANTETESISGSLTSVSTPTTTFESTSIDENSSENTTFEVTITTSTTDLESTSIELSTSESEPPSNCGDFIIDELLEQCDEGEKGNATCDSDCTFALCGDGNWNEIGEECDDSNGIDDDGCSNSCAKPRIVFLTSNYIGSPDFGGVNKADEFCQADANKFGIPGTFKAWLSDSNPNHDPVFRLNSFSFTGWYLMPSVPPTKLAKGWLGLQQDLLSPLNITSNGLNDFLVESVWTHTSISGESIDGFNNCNNWTNKEPSMGTGVGDPQKIDSRWSFMGPKSCGSDIGSKLYCFEVK